MPLEDLCERRHDHRAGQWVTFRELSHGTGSFANGRIDVAAFNCWPSKNFYRVAYEVKRSRADFLRELDQPDKRGHAEQYFHETWFCCTKDVCTPDEIPDGWGLLIPFRNGERLRRLKPARTREPKNLPTWMIAAILRRTAVAQEKAVARCYQHEGETVTAEDLQARVDALFMKTFAVQERQLAESHNDLRQAQDQLSRDRYELRGPLEVLGRTVRPYGVLEKVTVEEVNAWIAKCQAEVLAHTRAPLETAWRAIGTVLGKEAS